METLEKLTEEEIIHRVLNGEKPLYEIIVRRFNPFLYKIGRSYNYNHEDTQDLMQDTYIDAYRNLSQFEQRADFKTWIFRIMLNNCYRKKQKSSFKNEVNTDSLTENAKPMFSNAIPDAKKDINNNELGHVIENALVALPEEYRMVFSLREMNGLNVAETAALLGISEANVKVRLNRAKAMLRKAVEQAYHPEDIFEFNLKYCNPLTEKVMKRIDEL